MATFQGAAYPYTRNYFRHDLASVPRYRPKIFRLFREYAMLREKDAKQILEDGIEPRVVVKNLAPGYYGYTPPGSQEIWLHRTFLDELDPLLRVDNRYVEVQARAALLLEATILHELVHYGRKLSIGYSAGRRARDREERIARRFERDAYGRFVTASDLKMAQFMPKTVWADVHKG
jgi:hypothetical protein